jgi:hypothetical protein
MTSTPTAADTRPPPLDLGLVGRLALANTLPRKEVIQPHLPVRLPCYDFTLVTRFALDTGLPKVGLAASSPPRSHGVTGGVYKARVHIHRGVLTHGY